MPSHDDPSAAGPASAPDEAMPGDVCTTSEAARLLGVSNTTVQTMVERGELRAWKTLGGHRRISVAAIERLRRERLGGERRGAQALTVLLVEADEALRAVHEARLSSWGLPLRVLTAADGSTRC
jgi:excisionase family DNA binding protein